MAKSCPICERTSIVGGGYSNRIRATKFNPTGKVRKQLNLQWTVGKDGKRIRVCTRCMKNNKQLS